MCQCGWHTSVGYVGGVLGWRASVSGVPAWVKWEICQLGSHGWRTKGSSVGDIGENIRMVLCSIVGRAVFLKLFRKTYTKWILFKARERIQVSGHTHSKHTLFFRVFLEYLNLKVFFKTVSGTDSELWHIQNPGYINNPFNISCKTNILRFLIHAKSWYIENLRHIQNAVNL